MQLAVWSVVLVTLLYMPVMCLDNGLALAPALGFNTWYGICPWPSTALVHRIICTTPEAHKADGDMCAIPQECIWRRE